MDQTGFSLIEVLVALLLLTIGIHFSAYWLLQSTQLQKISSQYALMSLLGATIAERIATKTYSAELQGDWEKKLNSISENARLIVHSQPNSTLIIIEEKHSNNKILKWEVVPG